FSLGSVTGEWRIPGPDTEQESSGSHEHGRDNLDFDWKALPDAEELKDETEEKNRCAYANGNGTPLVFGFGRLRQLNRLGPEFRSRPIRKHYWIHAPSRAEYFGERIKIWRSVVVRSGQV